MTYENALRRELHSCPELIDLIQEVGFLPLLESGIRGFAAEDAVADTSHDIERVAVVGHVGRHTGACLRT